MERHLASIFLIAMVFLTSITACAPTVTDLPGPIQSQATDTITSTILYTETVVPPTPEASIGMPEASPTQFTISDPCAYPGNMYEHDAALGEIKEEYIGSWHAAPMVGSAYAERYVFYSTGNYVNYPSQYQCDQQNASCIPSPNEAGTWGIQGDQLNLARAGDIGWIKRIPVGKIVQADASESPYPYQTVIGETTYWQMSTETNLWNVETGELCP